MDFLTIIIQLVFGWLVKRWPALANWPNKLIPVFNAIIAVIIQIVAALTSVAHAADSLAVTALPQSHVGGHPGWWALWHFLQPVVMNTILSTGIFSTAKNIKQHLAGEQGGA